jgi:hypothetical protein
VKHFGYDFRHSGPQLDGSLIFEEFGTKPFGAAECCVPLKVAITLDTLEGGLGTNCVYAVGFLILLLREIKCT